jgi:hypothetical protein
VSYMHLNVCNTLTICIASSDWDLKLISADGVTFKVHRKNLSVHSAIFASADAISTAPLADVSVLPAESEVVTLSETADVLELLLKFMYWQPQPSLDNLSFGIIADLVKAAHKYEVFAATHRTEEAQRYVHFQYKKVCNFYGAG